MTSPDPIQRNLESMARRLRALERERRSRERWRRAASRTFAVVALTLGLSIPAISTAVDVPHLFESGAPIRADEFNANFAAVAASFDERIIREDTTIALTPTDGCDALLQALQDLDEVRIASTAMVTISLSPGDYACDETIAIRHPNGDRLRIEGSGNSPGQVTLAFPPDTNGVLVTESRALHDLANLTLQGGGGLENEGSGVIVMRSSSGIVRDVHVTGFVRDGLRAGQAGFLRGLGVTADDNGNVGFASYGGTVTLTSCSATSNGTHGFYAVSGEMPRPVSVLSIEREHVRTRLLRSMFGRESEPTKIGRFVVLDKRGEGGMGVVYAAYDPQLKREVAVKLLHRRDQGDDDTHGRERLLREAQAMARLSDPNVLPVFEAGEHHGHVFVAMELVQGTTLTGGLHETPRGWREIVAMYLQAARGLAAAHAAGIAHRDFKPENASAHFFGP